MLAIFVMLAASLSDRTGDAGGGGLDRPIGDLSP
jgi:hypothetical protein